MRLAKKRLQEAWFAPQGVTTLTTLKPLKLLIDHFTENSLYTRLE